MKNYDVLIPVDSKTLLSRILWLLGCLISLTLLIMSFYFKSGVIVLLDGILPIVFIIYKVISKKQLPIYFWLTCVSLLYPIYWTILDSPDYNVNSIAGEFNFSIFDILPVFILISIIIFLFNACTGNFLFKNLSKLTIRIFQIFIVFFIIIIEFFALNFYFDKPYKQQQIYVTDSFAGKGLISYDYKLSPESNEIYEITDAGFYIYNVAKIDQESGMKIITIEYGKGAFRIEWHDVVK